MEKNIFIEGYTASPFIPQLYRSIQRLNVKFNIYTSFQKANCLKNRFKYKQVNGLNLQFVNIFKPKFLLSIPVFKVLKITFLALVFKSIGKQPLFFLKIFKKQIYLFFLAKYLEEEIKIHTVHFHSISSRNIQLINYLSANTNKVVTFWGSDLLRNSGIYNYSMLYKGLKLANTITIANVEMREILLSKFGRDLKQKVVCNYFVLDTHLIDKMDSLKKDNIQNFKEKLGSRNSEIIVVVGNNGNINNNHIDILETIESLPAPVKNQLFVIIPATYALENTYREKLFHRLEISSFRGKILTKFISNEEMAALHVSTDVYVTMQNSDANSAFLLESLYSGSLCIAGSWLPYKKISTLCSNLKFADTFGELNEILQSFFKALDDGDKFKCDRILKEYYSKNIVNEWSKILSKKTSLKTI